VIRTWHPLKLSPLSSQLRLIGWINVTKTRTEIMTSFRCHLLLITIMLCGLTADVAVRLANARSYGPQPGPLLANWDAVKQLSSGREIRVVHKDAKPLQGTLESVNDEAVVIRVAMGQHTISKARVLRISSRSASHRLRNTAIGAAVRAGAGAGLGAAAGGDWGSRGAWAAMGAAECLVVGAVVGVALPTGTRCIAPRKGQAQVTEAPRHRQEACSRASSRLANRRP
jgi:hypothetical protein